MCVPSAASPPVLGHELPGPGYRILFTIVDDVVNILTIKAAEEDWITPSELE